MSTQKRLNACTYDTPTVKKAKLNCTSTNFVDISSPSTSQQSQKRNISCNSQHKSKVFKKQNGYVDSESDEDEESLFPRFHTPTNKSNSSSVGIIEKIALRNFMCHSNLEFQFGPNVNFIIGRNGSGKSAVLNGLMLALGSRSSITGRGSNLAGFIQTNKQFAIIAVTLQNFGNESFNRKVYGNFITIERRIALDGRSAYKIRNNDGKVVSTKRDDVNNILCFMNIQIDNPVGILTQDASKCFLESKDPRRRYELFLKATNLEKLKEDYKNVESRLKIVRCMLKTKQDTLPITEKELEKSKQKLRKVERCFLQKEKIIELNKELMWAIVRDSEELEAKQKQSYDALTEKFNHDLQSVQKIEEKSTSVKQKLKELKEKESNVKDKLKVEHNNYTEITKRYRESENNINRITMLLKNTTANINRIQNDITRLHSNIDELNQRSQEDLENKRREREIFLSDLESQKNKYTQAFNDLNTKITSYEAALHNSQEKICQIRQDQENLKNSKRNLEYEIKTMRDGLKNQASLFGAKMPQLISRIQAERRRFHKLPIGPIGMYIKIKESKWAFAVEICLGRGFLSSFCCDNSEDMNTLKRIMKEVYGTGMMPSINTCKFRDKVYHDIRHIEPQSLSVYDIISCDNPVITNCLIDNRGVESILLMEDSSKAMDLMMKSPPSGCKCCYIREGDQMFPAPNYRYYSCKIKPNKHSLFQHYDLNDIKETQQQVEKCQNDIASKTTEEEEENFVMQKQKQEFNRIKGQQMELKKKILHLATKIKLELESVTTDEPDVSSLNEELETQETSLAKYKNEHSTLKKEIEEATNILKSLKQERSIFGNSISEIKKDWENIGKDIDTLDQEGEKYVKHKNHYKTKCDNTKHQLSLIEKEYNEAKEKTITILQTAEEKFPGRVSTRRKTEDLKSQISEINSAVHEQLEGIDIESLARDVQSRTSTMEQVKKEIRNIHMHVDNLEKKLHLRQEKFKHIRCMITMRVQYLFDINMVSRGYKGALKFDHAKESLVVCADPSSLYDIDKRKEIVNNTNTLSGGERSFVTVALLLALSDVSEIPFHILDEYDVFMDAVNKELSLKMMLEKADEQRNNQFIFLSPLNLPPSAFKRQHLIRIHKMQDPERTDHSHST